MNNISDYKGYVITTEEGTEKGLFFRNPLQHVFHNTYHDSNPKLSAWIYIEKIKNPIRRLYEIIIGNGFVVKNVVDWSEYLNWAGFHANILCSPIYFKREYRKLKAISADMYNNDNIKEINSYGYENQFNYCAGDCEVEKTTIKLKNGRVIKLKNKDSYHYTYRNIVEKIIDTGVVEHDIQN